METSGTPAAGDSASRPVESGSPGGCPLPRAPTSTRPAPGGVRGIDGQIRAPEGVRVAGLDEERRLRVSVDVDSEGHGIGKLIVPLLVRPQAVEVMPANWRG